MNTGQERMNDDILEIATLHLRESQTIAGPSLELIGRTVAGMRRAPRQKTSWTAMAMAASVLLLIGIASWFFFRGSGEIAFADVMQQVMRTKSFQATIIEAADEYQDQRSARLSVKGPRGRFDADDGLIIIDDDQTGDTITLDTKAHLACRSNDPSNESPDIYAELRQIASQIPKSIGQKNFDGKILDGFSGPVKFMGVDGVTARVWVDPQTRLPARIELSMKPDDQPMTTIDNLKFDVPLDDSLFDMAVPRGYELRATLPMRAARHMRPQSASTQGMPVPTVEIPLPQTAAPAPTTQGLQELMLKPGIGIGKLRFGDSKEKIVSVFGQPQGVLRQGKMEMLEYSSAGIVLNVDEALGLQFIVAVGPSPANAPRFRSFVGSTDKGVRIGSTRAEIEAAYGKNYLTVAVRVMDHPEIHESELIYQQLGLWVIIDSGTGRCVSLWIGPAIAANVSTMPVR